MNKGILLILTLFLAAGCSEDSKQDLSSYTGSGGGPFVQNPIIDTTCVPPADATPGGTMWTHQVLYSRETRVLSITTTSFNERHVPTTATNSFTEDLTGLYPSGRLDLDFTTGTNANGVPFETRLIVGHFFGALIISQTSKNGDRDFNDAPVAHCVFLETENY